MSKKKAPIPEVPTPKNLQHVLNELVYKHGLNLRNQDQPRIDVLREVGIDPATVTDLMWDRAEEAFNKRLKSEADGLKLTWELTPIPEKWSTGTVTRWNSSCGRYSVVRFDRDKSHQYAAENGKPGSRRSIETDPKLGGSYARYYDTLREALAAVIRYHVKNYGVDMAKFRDNSEQLVEAEKNHSATPSDENAAIMAVEGDGEETVPKTNTEEEVSTTMPAATAVETVTLKEGAVRKMFKSLGVDTEGMGPKKLIQKLVKIDTYTSTGDVPDEDTPERRTLDKVHRALEDGAKIAIAGDEESNGEASETPAKKGGKREKKEPVKKSAKKSEKKDDEAEKTEPTTRKRAGSMVGTVIELLKKASEDKPTTKEKIHGQLMKKWPDHNPDSVRDSISWYISTMKKKQGIEVQKDGKGGFWIDD